MREALGFQCLMKCEFDNIQTAGRRLIEIHITKSASRCYQPATMLYAHAEVLQMQALKLQILVICCSRLR